MEACTRFRWTFEELPWSLDIFERFEASILSIKARKTLAFSRRVHTQFFSFSRLSESLEQARKTKTWKKKTLFDWTTSWMTIICFFVLFLPPGIMYASWRMDRQDLARLIPCWGVMIWTWRSTPNRWIKMRASYHDQLKRCSGNSWQRRTIESTHSTFKW